MWQSLLLHHPLLAAAVASGNAIYRLPILTLQTTAKLILTHRFLLAGRTLCTLNRSQHTCLYLGFGTPVALEQERHRIPGPSVES